MKFNVTAYFRKIKGPDGSEEYDCRCIEIYRFIDLYLHLSAFKLYQTIHALSLQQFPSPTRRNRDFGHGNMGFVIEPRACGIRSLHRMNDVSHEDETLHKRINLSSFPDITKLEGEKPRQTFVA